MLRVLPAVPCGRGSSRGSDGCRPESEVAVLGPIDLEGFRVLEHLGIAVGGRQREQDPVSCMDGGTTEFGVSHEMQAWVIGA